MTVTAIKDRLDEGLSDFDHQAHYVKGDDLLFEDAVVALCGKRWIPSKRIDVGDLPVCETCKALHGLLA